MKMKKILKMMLLMPMAMMGMYAMPDSSNGSGDSSAQEEGEENDSNSSNSPDDSSGSNDSNGNADGKTFTQAEVNRMLKAEKEKSKNSVLKELGVKDFKTAKDGIAKYLEQEAANKSDLQKANESVENLTKELEEANKNNAKLQAKIDAISLGANPKSVNDLVEIVISKIDEENDAKSVIESLKKNSAFSGFFNTVPESNGTGNPIGNRKPSSNSDSYGARLAKAKLQTQKNN